MKYNNIWSMKTLSEILEINPTTSLSKGTIAKKIGMEYLTEFVKKIQGYEITEFKSGSKFKNGDTLLARITPCLENGKTAFVDILDDEEIAFGSTEFFVLRAIEGKGDPQFIYYLATSDLIRTVAIKSMTGTSGRQRAQKEALLEYKLLLPNLETQRKIGKFLAKLDEKIDINNNLIERLEELCKTLFKRWFVDFEFPSEEGLLYKSCGGKFVESELGDIPENWNVGFIGDLGTVIGGGTPSKKEKSYYTNNGISWITPKDLSNNKSKFIYRGAIDITELGLKKSSAKLMPKGTVLFSSRAPIGYIAIAGKEVSTNQGFKSIVPDKGFSNIYIYFVLHHMLPTIESNAGGSTFKEISGQGLKTIKIILPPKDIVEEFTKLVKPLFEQIKSVEKENERLGQVRDILLPKLLSGEIEIPDESVVY